MSKADDQEPDDDLLPEYDFSAMSGGVRGKYVTAELAKSVANRRRELGLSAGTVDADIVIRERRTLWAPAAILLLWGIDALLHPLLHGHRDGAVVRAIFMALLVGAGFVEYVLYPAWISVGSRGLEYGQWFQRRRLVWDEIDSFAVGNPERPEVAYVLVRPKEPSTLHQPRRLPRLSSHSPEELVSVLRAKQRLFTRVGAEGNPGLADERRT